MTHSVTYKRTREKGFTVLETLIVVGLTTLVAVGMVAALLEGLETLSTVTDTQSVEFGHQKVMDTFIEDVQAATWFYNDYIHEDSGSLILRQTPHTTELTMGWLGPDDEQVWVRYSARPGIFDDEYYLMRTVYSTTPAGSGTSVMTTGVANLEFTYYTDTGMIATEFSTISRIMMTLSINIGGSTVERDYEVTMRNVNKGAKAPPEDLDDIENATFTK